MAFRKLSIDEFVPGKKEQIARETFYGKHEKLNDYIIDMMGYEEDGQWFNATGCTLGEMIDAVSSMPDDVLEKLVD